jgi:UPF0042 nucleotide-binding protein
MEKRVGDFMKSNRGYLTVAIGCTGGQHRSVYIVERLVERFAEKYPQVTARHTALRDQSTPRAAVAVSLSQ